MQRKQIVKGIESIYIPVTNPKDSANWYQKYLELELINPVSEDQAQLRITENQTIFLIRTKESTNLNYIEFGGVEMSAVTLEVNDFQYLYTRFNDENVKVDEIVEDVGCGSSFHVFDPDGNKLHIWAGWPQRLHEF